MSCLLSLPFFFLIFLIESRWLTIFTYKKHLNMPMIVKFSGSELVCISLHHLFIVLEMYPPLSRKAYMP